MAGDQRPGGVEAARVWIRRSGRRSVELFALAPGLSKAAVPRHQGLEWVIWDAEPRLCRLNGARLHQGGQGQTARLLEEVTALNPHAGTLCGPAGGLFDQRSPKGAQRVASEPTTGSTAGWMAAAGWAVAPAVALAMSRSAKGAQRAAGPAITGWNHRDQVPGQDQASVHHLQILLCSTNLRRDELCGLAQRHCHLVGKEEYASVAVEMGSEGVECRL